MHANANSLRRRSREPESFPDRVGSARQPSCSVATCCRRTAVWKDGLIGIGTLQHVITQSPLEGGACIQNRSVVLASALRRAFDISTINDLLCPAAYYFVREPIRGL